MVKIKPHLSVRKGYWCVSPLPKPYFKYRAAWNKAYTRKMELNYRRAAHG